jgi:hypothetical protein
MMDKNESYTEAAELLATIQFCMCVFEHGEYRFWHCNENGLELPCETLANLGLMSPLPPSGHAFTNEWRPGDSLDLRVVGNRPSPEELEERLLFFVEVRFPDILAKGDPPKERPVWIEHDRHSNVALMKWTIHRAEDYLLARS